MTDDVLAESNIEHFIRNISPYLWNTIKEIEEQEYWVLSPTKYKSLYEFWEDFWKEIGDSDSPDIVFNESQYPFIVLLLAYMSISRAYRVLNLLSQIQPGFAGDIIKFCHETDLKSDPAKFLLFKRFRIMARLECWQRLFGEDKRRKIKEILEKEI